MVHRVQQLPVDSKSHMWLRSCSEPSGLITKAQSAAALLLLLLCTGGPRPGPLP